MAQKNKEHSSLLAYAIIFFLLLLITAYLVLSQAVNETSAPSDSAKPTLLLKFDSLF